jgi:hypothetical protein
MIGIRLEGRERRRLNDLKLVESEKPGRSFVHELSDAGWQWCADELADGPFGRASSLERAQYLMFRVFDRYLDAARLSLADLVSLDLKARPAGRHKRRDAVDGEGDQAARATAARRLPPDAQLPRGHFTGRRAPRRYSGRQSGRSFRHDRCRGHGHVRRAH